MCQRGHQGLIDAQFIIRMDMNVLYIYLRNDNLGSAHPVIQHPVETVFVLQLPEGAAPEFLF